MTSAGKARQVQGVGGRMYALCHKKLMVYAKNNWQLWFKTWQIY